MHKYCVQCICGLRWEYNIYFIRWNYTPNTFNLHSFPSPKKVLVYSNVENKTLINLCNQWTMSLKCKFSKKIQLNLNTNESFHWFRFKSLFNFMHLIKYATLWRISRTYKLRSNHFRSDQKIIKKSKSDISRTLCVLCGG